MKMLLLISAPLRKKADTFGLLTVGRIIVETIGKRQAKLEISQCRRRALLWRNSIATAKKPSCYTITSLIRCHHRSCQDKGDRVMPIFALVPIAAGLRL